MKSKTVTMPRELTAENGAKGLLSGEFVIDDTESCGCNGNDKYCEECNGSGVLGSKVTVPWTTIKDIYAMAVKLFAESEQVINYE